MWSVSLTPDILFKLTQFLFVIFENWTNHEKLTKKSQLKNTSAEVSIELGRHL